MPPGPPAPPPDPPEFRSFKTSAEIDAAIGRLRRRIADIEQLRADRARFDGPSVYIVQEAIRDTIREIFGADSAQFKRHRYFSIDDGPKWLGALEDPSLFVSRHQQQFEQETPGAISRIEELIRALEEERGGL